MYFAIPLLPIFIIFFIGCIAETNRAPFDLAEAESELVSGFMTEHSAVIFVFFFLAEYASIVLICIFTSILFLGGYLKIFTFDIITEILFFFNIINVNEYFIYWTETHTNIFNVFLDGLITSLSLGFKSCLMIFVFIWARASYPRIRFDQLMSFCWTILLPIVIALIVLDPCIIYGFDIIPTNISLLSLPILVKNDVLSKITILKKK